MSNALATLGGEIAVSKYGPMDDNQEDFTSGGDFHPRLQFYSSQATAVKKKQFLCDHFGAVIKKGETKDLGESFNAIPLTYRYCALDFRVDKQVKSYFDPRTPEFKEVKKDAEMKRPPGEKSKTMAGAQFLFYIENFGFATLLCSSKTLKGVAKSLFGMMQKYVTIGHKLYEAGDFAWEGPTVTEYPGTFDIAEKDAVRLKKVCDSFSQASKPTVAEAEDETDEAATPAAETTDGRVR